jgi:hypothetical protein
MKLNRPFCALRFYSAARLDFRPVRIAAGRRPRGDKIAIPIATIS